MRNIAEKWLDWKLEGRMGLGASPNMSLKTFAERRRYLLNHAAVRKAALP